ncbi:hypothetical protein [Nocardiopsis composta]|uniref:Uncharacterized protein n=1 Tax=Nocardiopsis composta TaxID=157465 RepID=A0A7W8QPX9_9ACTN|nr:hypothetical protein [Nocardiopsis composta]MBB5433743.1 hypothetical protein [Nocardiopsis composta]
MTAPVDYLPAPARWLAWQMPDSGRVYAMPRGDRWWPWGLLTPGHPDPQTVAAVIEDAEARARELWRLRWQPPARPEGVTVR